MNTPSQKPSLLAGVGKTLPIVCLGLILLLLSYFSLNTKAASSNNPPLKASTPVPVALASYIAVDPQARHKIREEVPTVPTVPTTEPTTTATPTATPSPSPTPVNPTISYRVSFKNTTGQTIIDAKIDFIIPPYTTFNFEQSTVGWVCLNGITAGNKCQYHFGNVPPAQDSTPPLEAVIVLNVLRDQLPTNTSTIDFDVNVVDSSGRIYATYNVIAKVPNRGWLYLPMIKSLRNF
ncbi:MAG: hypothetical protein NT075_16550 [Chloroflexi bacterium]|nr:hypothetical protein [Chloroflexota bacterium]